LVTEQNRRNNVKRNAILTTACVCLLDKYIISCGENKLLLKHTNQLPLPNLYRVFFFL